MAPRGRKLRSKAATEEEEEGKCAFLNSYVAC